MSILRAATHEQVEALYRESYSIWGGGLSFEDYLGVWNDLKATRWGRRFVTYLVCCDSRGQVLSSLKLYRPTVRVGGSKSRAAVLGAVFTPTRIRRRGHAADLIRAVLRQAEARGDRPALLFSDVGADYYSALGFHPLPAEEIRGRLPRASRGRRVPIDLRPYRDSDLEAILRAHEETARTRDVAVLRDSDHFEFLLVRTRSFFRRLGDPAVEPRSLVAWDGEQAIGYLWTVEGRGEWSVREVAARGGDPTTMARIVAAGAEDAARRGLRTVHGWLPREVCAGLTGWKLRREARTRAIPMVAALGAPLATEATDSPDRLFIPFPDQF